MSIFKRYRVLPLVITGLLFYLIFTALSLFIWSFFAYHRQTAVAESSMPLLFYLGGLFLTSLLMTGLIKGGTVFPSAATALLISIFSMILAEPGSVGFGWAILKILVSLLVSAAGFSLAKMWCLMRGPRHRAPRHRPVTEPAISTERQEALEKTQPFDLDAAIRQAIRDAEKKTPESEQNDLPL